MFLTIDSPNGSTRTLNLAHAVEVYYRPAGESGPSHLSIEDARGGERLRYQGPDADALHATLAELLASGKVASFRCKLPPGGGYAS